MKATTLPATWAEVIERNASLYPDSTAFRQGGESLTFGAFDRRVNQLVNALHGAGLKKGGVVGVIGWNSLNYALLFGAAMKGGFILSPMNPRLTPSEVGPLTSYSTARVLFASGEWEKEALNLGPGTAVSLEKKSALLPTLDEFIAPHSREERGIEVTPEDPFALFYTSGTTGAPKGALYTHGRNLHHTRTRAKLAGIVPDSSHVMILPLFHIGGYSHFWTFFNEGAPNILAEGKVFDAAGTLELITASRATDLHIVPSHLGALLAAAEGNTYDLGSLRCIWYAASPMPATLLKKGMTRFGPIFRQGYGQTETGPDIASLSDRDHDVLHLPEEAQTILSSCGRPVPDVEVKITGAEGQTLGCGEVGEITVKSPTVMTGYWNLPEITAQTVVDGWVHTGDLGRFDKNGYLYLVGRKKDMIITGGENVYPLEIEELLHAHPAIAEAAVIGLPDPRWIEKVHAVVVLKRGQNPDPAQLSDYLRTRLAPFKVPKPIEIVSELPKNPQGKTLKRQLIEERR